MTLLEAPSLPTASFTDLLRPGLEATFVAVEPARESWFALWDPDELGGLFEDEQPQSDIETVTVQLQRPRTHGTSSVPVTATKLSIEDAVALLARLPANAAVATSVKAWSRVIRFGLDAVARARILPWVSPQGWDTWRLDPLDAEDIAMVDALAASLPATGFCVPSAAGSGRISDPKHAVRSCLDSVADHTVRVAAEQAGISVPAFGEHDRLRVRHLSPWVTDLAAVHCAASSLLLRIHPPVEKPSAAEKSSVESVFGDAPVDEADELYDGRWTVVVELRSQEDPSLVVPVGDLRDLAPEVRNRLGDRVDIDVLVGLRAAVEACPVLLPLLEQVRPSVLKLEEDELDDLLSCLDALTAAGVDLHWPSTLLTPTLKRRLVVHSEFGPQSAMKSTMGIDNLIDVDWEFLLDGVALNESELQLLSDAKRSVVSLRGRWVRVDSTTSTWLRAKPPKMTVIDGLAAALGSPLGDVDGDNPAPEVVVDGPLAEMVTRLQTFDRSTELTEPAKLQATLRGYQRQGLAWLAELTELGLGACLADDMGLGKTIQVLALHEHMSQIDSDVDAAFGPTLIVCPTSLMNNWEREAAKFLPDLTVHRFHGPKRCLDDVGRSDLVITTYGVVRTDHETLSTVDWGLAVADEAQHAKNPQSSTAKSLRKVPARTRIAMTGTPVENHLTELWSIIDWVLPGLLGNVERFRRVLAVPIERDGDTNATEKLHQLVEPFLLRRRKTDPGIAPDLPPKTERDVVVPLTPEQITLYRAAVEEALDELAKAKGIKRHGRILSLLTSLKQITNHPAQYLGESGPLGKRSGKLDAVERLVDSAVDNTESTLVFSQYVTMGNMLVEHFTRRGIRASLLHGGLSVNQRQTLVDDFQANKLDVLVLSLKAGGTGLNLTQASNVIHYDRWWNPAVEDQATDRAYRIGQGKPVTVHRLITEGTVEDRVAELLRNKRELSDRVLNSGASWIGNLDDNDLAALVTLDSGCGGDA